MRQASSAPICAPGLKLEARTRKLWPKNVVLRGPRSNNWFKDDAFLAEKACALAEFRVDLSDIPLTHRRDRIEVAGIANDEDEKSDTRLRALRQIADETAADVEGMVAALQEQIALLERQKTML